MTLSSMAAVALHCSQGGFRYVRSLERRLLELERMVANMPSLPTGDSLPDNESPTSPASVRGPTYPMDAAVNLNDPAFQTPGRNPIFPQSPGADLNLTTSSPSLVDELKSLIYEATAERHLGSSSGLSFAKLTQTVLRRLTPNLTDFAFRNSNAYTGRLLDFDSSVSLSDSSMLESLNNSISIHPLLFGEPILTNSSDPGITQPFISLPDNEVHVNGLIDFYFAHSHTLYPIVHRGELQQSLQQLRSDPMNQTGQPSLNLYRIWMVLAIGSTAYCSVSISEESESRSYYHKALDYLEPAIGHSETVSFICLPYLHRGTAD